MLSNVDRSDEASFAAGRDLRHEFGSAARQRAPVCDMANSAVRATMFGRQADDMHRHYAHLASVDVMQITLVDGAATDGLLTALRRCLFRNPPRR